uniref:Bromo domain-containing protein n=1 Tax=Romanomermis culicivorax TaxID=13658 RepID=A0A915ITL8_ROMCU
MRLLRKIHEGKYRSIDQLEADVFLLCENAQIYNIEGSEIYNDSVFLKNLWTAARDRFNKEFGNQFYNDMDEDTHSVNSTSALTPRGERPDTPSESMMSEENSNSKASFDDMTRRRSHSRKSKPVHSFIEDEDEDEALNLGAVLTPKARIASKNFDFEASKTSSTSFFPHILVQLLMIARDLYAI